MRTILISLCLLALVTPAYAQDATVQPYTAFVAPEGGLRVREEPQAGSRILATLWQGARVFVREGDTEFVRIDGYGVAGFAFVDPSYLVDEPPAQPAAAPATAQPAQPRTR